MLVATFAVAFLLQSIALLFGLRGEDRRVGSSVLAEPPRLDRGRRHPQDHDRRHRRRGRALGLARAPARQDRIGLHMRAAAIDFQTARLLGVSANRVITAAVAVSGALAAAVSVMLTVQNPLVTSGLRAPRHDHRARRRRRRGDGPPVVGDARRLHDRVRVGLLGGALPTDQTSLPAVVRVRAGDPRPARAAGGPVRAAADDVWSACEAVRHRRPARRPPPRSSSRGRRRLVRRARSRSTSSTRSSRSRSSSRSTSSSATRASSRSATSASSRSAPSPRA